MTTNNSYTSEQVCMASLQSMSSLVISRKHLPPNLVHPSGHFATTTVTASGPPHFCSWLPAQAMLHLSEATWFRATVSCPTSVKQLQSSPLNQYFCNKIDFYRNETYIEKSCNSKSIFRTLDNTSMMSQRSSTKCCIGAVIGVWG